MFKASLFFLSIVIFCFSCDASKSTIEYWPNGKKQSEYILKNGKINGNATFWYESGSIKIMAEYKDGEQNGLATSWYESGVKLSEAVYKDNLQNGKYLDWYESGAKKSDCEWKNGKLNGKSIDWYENGAKKSVYEWKEGRPIGKITEWDENGKKVAEQEIQDNANKVFRNYEFPENVAISIPSNWFILQGKEAEISLKNNLKELIKETKVETILPIDETIAQMKPLISAIYKMDNQIARVSLTATYKEMSQSMLENLSQEEQSALTALMKKQIMPFLNSQNYIMVNFSPSKIEKINSNFCFTLAFTYKENDTIYFSEVRHFYLERGTFVLTVTYSQSFSENFKDESNKIIKSFIIK